LTNYHDCVIYIPNRGDIKTISEREEIMKITVGNGIFESWDAAVEAAALWWNTACGTQKESWEDISEDELEMVKGWGQVVSHPELQDEFDEAVLCYIRSKMK